MTTISGLPAHVLLVHFVVVLVPLTALLVMLCAVWPAARRRLVWFVVAMAIVTMVLTPLTVEAGEWLYAQQSEPSATLQTHAERGAYMPYLSAAMLLVAIVLAAMHVMEGRSDRRRAVANVVIAFVAVAVGISAIVAAVRTGDSGAHAVWGGS
ncbi:hypothetical protein CQY20_30170 [Mycolicibacterium agri]|uniref:DUF2231 domain-containing protein n=1 Tax=Mycolicibacterium agri TaxID=36811 RepID=A0A2A7MPP6_MYCAG|nr:DUF2231 domain-containing protein [Mycolicibacterium agri]PEG33549.1 hypothetical protein CQY20_30170 [Mycolicibacterium agri]GFG52954.1 hypothetical protein MAGR_43950 [Mycolicibacterium agri]